MFLRKCFGGEEHVFLYNALLFFYNKLWDVGENEC